MLQCPTCHSEVKPEERFCGNCGARLPEQAAPRPVTGKETVVLPSLGDVPPPAPPAEKTIIAGPAPIPPSQFPAAPNTPPAGQLPPTTPLSPPGAAYPNANVPPVYPGANLPPGAVAPPPKSGSNVWKILGIIAGIGVLACVALSVGGYILFNRFISQSSSALSTAAAAGLATVEAFPTFAPDAFATAEPTPEDEPTPAEAEPTPKATPASGTGSAGSGAVLLSESFDDESTSDFSAGESDNAIYSFVNGVYTVKAKQPKLIVWQTLSGDYSDAAISVDTTVEGPEKSAAGLIFHYQDNENFYIYTVAGDRSYSLDLYENDQLTHLIDWTDSAAINAPGQTNALRVETEGDTIRLFANGQLLDEISDATFSRGKAAIVVNTFDDPNVTVGFDNLVVQAIK